MINKLLHFYGLERKDCCEDYRFRLGMIHLKVPNGLGGRSGGERERIYFPSPSSGKEQYVMCSEEFKFFFLSLSPPFGKGL